MASATRADNLRGAAWMSTAMFGYVVNDALIKWAAEAMPLFQAIVLRGSLIIVILAIATRRSGATVRRQDLAQPALVLRVTMEAVGTVVYLLALTKVPLASLTAMLQLVPIAVTFAAARLLRERVDPTRASAVLAGFVGVLLIIRPGSGEFSPWFLAGLVAVGIVVVRELATQRISAELPGVAVALCTAVAITVLAAAISIVDGWQMVEGRRLAALGVAACFLSLGYVGSVHSVRLGDLSFTAPFRYTVLVFAIALQIVVFGDVPDVLTFVGAGIIAAAGLAALRTRP